jgi:hypothetical protein
VRRRDVGDGVTYPRSRTRCRVRFRREKNRARKVEPTATKVEIRYSNKLTTSLTDDSFDAAWSAVEKHDADKHTAILGTTYPPPAICAHEQAYERARWIRTRIRKRTARPFISCGLVSQDIIQSATCTRTRRTRRSKQQQKSGSSSCAVVVLVLLFVNKEYARTRTRTHTRT